MPAARAPATVSATAAGAAGGAPFSALAAPPARYTGSGRPTINCPKVVERGAPAESVHVLASGQVRSERTVPSRIATLPAGQCGLNGSLPGTCTRVTTGLPAVVATTVRAPL